MVPIKNLNSIQVCIYKKVFELTLVSFTVGEKKDSTLHRAYGVKLLLLRALWAGQGLILPLKE